MQVTDADIRVVPCDRREDLFCLLHSRPADLDATAEAAAGAASASPKKGSLRARSLETDVGDCGNCACEAGGFAKRCVVEGCWCWGL
jgi:hypothetical protein